MKRYALLIPVLALTLVLLATSIGNAITYPNMANIVKPNPEPTLPGGSDTFIPPVSSFTPSANAPAVAEWTRTGAPDNTLILTGSHFSSYNGADQGKDTTFMTYGQIGGSGVMIDSQVQRLDGLKAAVTLDTSLPTWSMYLLWPCNSVGAGYPVAVNKTEAWWVGPNAASPGQTISIFGRNLSQNNGTTNSWVYIKPTGSSGQWATVTAVNPYKVDFTVPSLTNGIYEVWVHNGHGGHYGWSGPVTFTVQSAYTWSGGTFNVKTYGAKGDGVTDDTAAINSAISATGNTPDCIIYFPTGTYMVHSVINCGGGYGTARKMLGDGQASTTIRATSSFVSSCLVNVSADNSVLNALTLDTNSTGVAEAIEARSPNNLTLNNIQVISAGTYALDTTNGSGYTFSSCNFITGSGIFFGNTSQIFITNCNFYGRDDTNVMLYHWAGNGFCMTGCTMQDYDNSQSWGWSRGRFYTFSPVWGTIQNVYCGNNTTTALSVRPGVDANEGEQFLSEGTSPNYMSTPASATPTTVTFTNLSVSSWVGYEAVICAGTGIGQHRTITASNGQTITVSPTWNVPPDSTSMLSLTSTAMRVAIYDNSLQGKSDYASRPTASTGVEIYQGGQDIIVDNNTITQTNYGTSIWGVFNANWYVDPSCFILIENNHVSNCGMGARDVSQVLNNAVTNYSDYFANIYRNNTYTNMAIDGIQLGNWNDGTVPKVWDFFLAEHNTFTNTPYAFDFLQGDSSATQVSLFYKNNCNGLPSGVSGVNFAGTGQQVDLQQNTWSNFPTAYADQLPGAVLEIPYRTITVNGTSNGDKATGSLTIWNSGTTALNWMVTTTPASWLVLSASSGTAPNENSASTITLTCNPSGLAQGTYTATVSITGALQTKMVTVTFLLGAPVKMAQRPDLSARPSNVTSYTGMGIYNLDGTGQTVSLAVAKGVKASYYIHAQNNGTAADTLKMTGTPAPAGWAVDYVDYATSTVITSAVTGAGWSTALLKPGAIVTLAVYVTPGATITGGKDTMQTVTATSVGDASKQDAVLLKTSIPLVNKPDLSLRASTETTYSGVGVYNLTGASQTVSQAVLKNVKATYYVHVQNNGNVPETFIITGTPAPAGWTVDYKDYSTGTIITGAVTGAGWTTPVVNTGAVVTVAVYVTPGATVTGSSIATQTVTVTSSGDTSKQDVGVINTTLTVLHRPDLSLRPATGSAYAGVGVYSMDGTTQTVSLSAANGVTANYNVQAQNNGNVPEAFNITAPSAPTGWTVTYMYGTTPITSAVTGAGWETPVLDPAATIFITVAVMPGDTLLNGAVLTQKVTLASSADVTIQDVGLLKTTVPVVRHPDLSLRPSTITTYTGMGVYNLNGTDQTVGLTVAKSVKATYYIHIKNNGNITDTCAITASAASAGWTVDYKNYTTGEVITSAVTGTGWVTLTLIPGAVATVAVYVTPGTTISSGAIATQKITATSVGDTTKKDVVVVQTTVK